MSNSKSKNNDNAVSALNSNDDVPVHNFGNGNSSTSKNTQHNKQNTQIYKPKSRGFPEATEEITITVMKVDYKVHKTSTGRERPVIHVFGRQPETNELEHILVYNFRPYFYVPRHEAKGINNSTITEQKNPRADSIRGNKVTKLHTKLPRHIGYVRDDFNSTYEADIRFPNRFLIDNDIKSGMKVPARRDGNGKIIVPVEEVEPADAKADARMNVFDIEVEDRNGFPENGEEPIICIASWDSYLDEYVIWLYESPKADNAPIEVDGYEPLKDMEYHVVKFDEEDKMLSSFIEYIRETDPDILTGWNFDDFDAPYLVDRLEELDDDSEYDLNPDRLSRINDVWNGWSTEIKGRVVFDLLEAYKRTQFSELDSYRLDAVAEDELGVGKEHYDGKIGDMWDDNPRQLIEYNLRDVELCVELDKKQSIIAFWDEVRTFVGCQLSDATTPSDAVDMYFLHKVHGKYILPSKGEAEEGEEYEGGAVFDPIEGVVDNVTVLDLKSLYPMCMITINASPETKIDDPENYDGEVFYSPTGIAFRKEPDGIIREVLEELLGEREKKKELRSQYTPKDDEYHKFDRQQAAVKVIMNSTYGVLGWPRFRLYDKEMGAGVTSTGREVIKFTEEVSERLGYEVTYGDTDSVMLELGNISLDDISGDIEVSDELRESHPEMSEEDMMKLQYCLDRSFEIEDEINESYSEFAQEQLNAENHRFQIEFEKLYRRFFQAARKKRYAGNIIWKEGDHVDKIDITGFEAERSDIAPITRKTQTEVIEMIVRGQGEDKIRTHMHDVITDFRSGDIGLDDIGIPGGIGQKLDEYDNATAHVRGAKYANLLLETNFNHGSKPKRVYLEKVHPDFFNENDISPKTSEEQELLQQFKKDPDVICYTFASQVPDEFMVATDKMLNKTMKKPISRVIEAVGIPWDDVRAGQTQKGLDGFM